MNTGLLAEHTVTKISARKICSIYTKRKLGGVGKGMPGRAQGRWRLSHSGGWWGGEKKGLVHSGPMGLEGEGS